MKLNESNSIRQQIFVYKGKQAEILCSACLPIYLFVVGWEILKKHLKYIFTML